MALAQQVGAGSLAAPPFTQPGRDFIHPWWMLGPSRRAGLVPDGRWPRGALPADSLLWASLGTKALSTSVVPLPK